MTTKIEYRNSCRNCFRFVPFERKFQCMPLNSARWALCKINLKEAEKLANQHTILKGNELIIMQYLYPWQQEAIHLVRGNGLEASTLHLSTHITALITNINFSMFHIRGEHEDI